MHKYARLMALMIGATLFRPAQADPQTLAPGATFRDCTTVCPEMVIIPSGRFVMGSPDSERSRDAGETQHEVVIGYALAVGKYDVTFDEWDACVADHGCDGSHADDRGWGRGRMPVLGPSWDDAQSFVGWLSRKTGKKYRLLSESEWEYAARAGTTTAYYWGDTASHQYANYGNDACCSGAAVGADRWVNSSPVGSFPPNAFGLYDMLGNVSQWVEDRYNENYVGGPADGSARTQINQESVGECTDDKADPKSCDWRVLRGSSWVSPPGLLGVARRSQSAASCSFCGNTFRVAREL